MRIKLYTHYDIIVFSIDRISIVFFFFSVLIRIVNKRWRSRSIVERVSRVRTSTRSFGESFVVPQVK